LIERDSRRLHAFTRHVPPRGRIIALLPRSGVCDQQRLEALEILFRRVEFGLHRGDLGPCGGDLRLGLADVLDARAGEHQAKLRVSLRLFGTSTHEGQFDVTAVQRENRLALFDAVALGEVQREDASSRVWGEPGLGGLHMT
jgi:hypothetical protein